MDVESNGGEAALSAAAASGAAPASSASSSSHPSPPQKSAPSRYEMARLHAVVARALTAFVGQSAAHLECLCSSASLTHIAAAARAIVAQDEEAPTPTSTPRRYVEAMAAFTDVLQLLVAVVTSASRAARRAVQKRLHASVIQALLLAGARRRPAFGGGAAEGGRGGDSVGGGLGAARSGGDSAAAAARRGAARLPDATVRAALALLGECAKHLARQPLALLRRFLDDLVAPLLAPHLHGAGALTTDAVELCATLAAEVGYIERGMLR